MGSFNWQDLWAMGPVATMVVAGCVLLLSEVSLGGRERAYQGWLSAAFAGVAFFWAWTQTDDPAADVFGGFGRVDAYGAYAAMVVSFALALSSLVAQGFLKEQASERGEFHALGHFAAAGMVLLAETTDLLTMFVAVEVMSLATYALTAWLRSSARPAEAALKYFILGSFSSAVMLYGASLAYGAAGSTKFADLAKAVAAGQHPTLVLAAVVLLLAGFLFKVAAVPFHMWAPDVYDGAPTPVTGFMASGVKVAAFAALMRLLYVAFGAEALATGAGGGKGWVAAVSAAAVLTMVAGNLMALAQKSVKRMLAYSSISHAGYLLVGVASGAYAGARAEATQATLFYLFAYTATAIGAFAVVGALEKRGGQELDVDGRYDGLAQRHPLLALALTVFVLSLAGIPPTAGFTAKFFIFRSALDAGQVGLAVVGLLSSVAGLYYYLRVLVMVFMKAPAPNAAELPARLPMANLGLWAAAVAVVAFGVLPGSVQELTRAAATLAP